MVLGHRWLSMESRTNVSPIQIQIEVDETAITLLYLDGRSVHYRAPIRDESTSVRAAQTYEIHVLVTDREQTHGYMTYINDLDTTDDILRATGVGRVLLADGASATIHQGVTAQRDGETIEVNVRDTVVPGTVYVFVEHQLEERAYRLGTTGSA